MPDGTISCKSEFDATKASSSLATVIVGMAIRVISGKNGRSRLTSAEMKYLLAYAQLRGSSKTFSELNILSRQARSLFHVDVMCCASEHYDARASNSVLSD